MDPLTMDDPRQVGVFRLHARLGAGGMGRVYLGYSPAGRAVAVKIVHPDLARDPEFVRRFRREILAVEAVSGAYTAPVVGAGPDESPPWLATAFVAGPSLADLVDRAGPLPAAAVWRLAGGLIEALQAIHGRGLVHRDLKPGNVLIAADGPRVIDFGISGALEGVGTVLTAARATMGTPAYMSPEQAEGRNVGPPSDVFSLGSVVAFASTGTVPFDGDSAFSIAYRVVHAKPDLSRLPPALRGLVNGCLAKDPASRPSLAQLMDTIVAVGGLQEAAHGKFWPDQVERLVAGQGSAAAHPVTADAGGYAADVTHTILPAYPRVTPEEAARTHEDALRALANEAQAREPADPLRVPPGGWRAPVPATQERSRRWVVVVLVVVVIAVAVAAATLTLVLGFRSAGQEHLPGHAASANHSAVARSTAAAASISHTASPATAAPSASAA